MGPSVAVPVGVAVEVPVAVPADASVAVAVAPKAVGVPAVDVPPSGSPEGVEPGAAVDVPPVAGVLCAGAALEAPPEQAPSTKHNALTAAAATFSALSLCSGSRRRA